jgi:hypothetical protein
MKNNMKTYIVYWHTIDRDGETCRTGYSVVDGASNQRDAQRLFRQRGVDLYLGERLRIETVTGR